MRIELTIPGPPWPQPAPKASRVGAFAKLSKRKPPKAIRDALARAAGDAGPASGPLSMAVTAVWPRPAATRGDTARWQAKAVGTATAVADGILAAGTDILWGNPNQVAMLVVRRIIAAQGEPPEVHVVVASLPEEV